MKAQGLAFHTLWTHWDWMCCFSYMAAKLE